MVRRTEIFRLTLLAGVSFFLYQYLGMAGLIPGVAALVIWRREAQFLLRAGLQEDSGAIGASLAVLLFFAFCCMSPPGAPDDVLRDIASSSYGYDYHRMYPGSDIQRYNAYIGFDHLLAMLSGIVGPEGALHVIQAAGAVSFLVLFVLLARRISQALEVEHYALIALAFATPLSARIFLARPEVLLTAWALYATLALKPWQVAVWVLTGALFTTGYWLAALYFPFALLLPTRFRVKVAVGCVLTAWSFGFWYVASHGTYVESLGLLSSWPKNRVADIQETKSFLQLLLNPYFMALTLMAGISCTSRKLQARDYQVFALISYFFLSGMVRYAAVWVGLLLILALPWLDSQRVKNLWWRAGLLLFPFYCAAAAFGGAVPFHSLPSFTYPQGAYVLTGFNTSTFATPFFNPGRVSVAPSMELGANTRAVQTLAVELSKGQLECKALLAEPFTHVVEDRLTVVPPCLRLVAVKGAWREWQVVR